MSTVDPLDPLRKAKEEEYFLRENKRLIEALKERVESEVATEELQEATGLDDDAVLAELARAGITRAQVPLLHLAPLLEVAWADGHVQPSERDLLHESARQVGIAPDSPAMAELERMTHERPSDAFFVAACTFLKALLLAMPAAEAERARHDLLSLATRVAKVTSTFWGVLTGLEDGEKQALHRIAERLEAERPHAVRSIFDKLR